MVMRMRQRMPGGDTYRWTDHVMRKMRFYGLTPARVLRVIRAPRRMEEGVAPGTLAAMQPAGTKAKPWEVWVMWREDGRRKVVITAWRYPGISPIRGAVPLPVGLAAELEAEGVFVIS
jgi:hypothetical protein